MNEIIYLKVVDPELNSVGPEVEVEVVEGVTSRVKYEKDYLMRPGVTLLHYGWFKRGGSVELMREEIKAINKLLIPQIIESNKPTEGIKFIFADNALISTSIAALHKIVHND